MEEELEPEAYTIGSIDFLGSKIDLSQRPLIPRIETEFWLGKAIEAIQANEANEAIRCLDIFSGSGCIGVAILKHFESAVVDFVDIDDRAIKQIGINCKSNNIDNSRFNIIKSDIFENVLDSYDYIFANPPYVAESKIEDVQDSVLNYEPHNALFGGSDGLTYIRPFLVEAYKHLNKGGKIYMEFDPHEKDDIEKIAKLAGYKEINFHLDQFQRWRYLEAS